MKPFAAGTESDFFAADAATAEPVSVVARHRASNVRSLTITPPPFHERIECFDLEESALQAGPQRLQASECDLFAGRVGLVARHLPLVERIEEEDVGILFRRAG